MHAAATTSQVLLICSPRLSAIAPRQTAAANATPAQNRWPRIFLRPEAAAAGVEVAGGISEFLQPAQSRTGADAGAQRHFVNRVRVLVHGPDVTGAGARVAHEDNEITSLRIPQAAELNRAGFRLPAILCRGPELPHDGPIIVIVREVQVAGIRDLINHAWLESSDANHTDGDKAGDRADQKREAYELAHARIRHRLGANPDHRSGRFRLR